MRGHNPDWANLPRRKCDNCGHSYKPIQPLKEGQRGFCKGNCRKEYHKHGGAYRKLKGEMQKMVDRKFRELDSRLAMMIEHEFTRRAIPTLQGLADSTLSRHQGRSTASQLPSPQPRA